ncbi:zinc ribbon domain-containing protein [Pantoea agglomerans]|uniref:zinc ribbon domain-containing protein n=1 Tax=Enterobacter agglomerans TaxID=549 RepID=UPI000F02431E|nr:zinc ribbon domain-containing protein [Pantoea agglomerans]AYP22507.1 zinc ribbon domain-containing protein [Pantoea agglomerans]
MFCNKCGSSISETVNYCGQCGEDLRVTKGGVNQSIAGDNGFSAGQYNNFTGNTINLGVKDEKPIAIIDRKYEKPVKFMGKHIKTAWLMVAGLVGFLANLATLFSSIGTPSNNNLLFGLLIGFSLFLLSLGFLLKKFRFVHLLFGTNVESDKSGYVYITKVGGDCPLCDGQLKLSNFGPKNKNNCYYVAQEILNIGLLLIQLY